jgi:tetratricopeptide (TPR) repeat protein
LRPAQCDGLASCADFIGSGQAAGLAIIVFYFTLGFMLGYVWTRLYFQRDLAGLVENLQLDKRVTDLIMLAEAFVKEGELDEAMESIDQALKNNPLDGRAVLTKGRILKCKAMKLEKPEKDKLLNQALDYASRAIALLPGKGEPIYNKACYQALLGFDRFDRNEVLGNLKSAFRLNPALRGIARGDDDLKSLSNDDDFVKITGQEPAA